MQADSGPWDGAGLPFETIYAIANDTLALRDVRLFPQIFALSAGNGEFWLTEQGQVILTEMLALLLDELNLGDAQAAIAAMEHCPHDVAQQAHDLLLLALGADGVPADPADLDDAAILCSALLLGAAGKHDAVPNLIRETSAGRTSLYFFKVAGEIARQFSEATEPDGFKPKLIIWDLDDTLWQGTLAEGDEPLLNPRRAEFVRSFNRHGIVSAICSKNDPEAARAALQKFGLWDEFVFPRIAFVPKGPAVRQIIEDMQLRPVNVLFVDDNPHNLHEVAAAVPGIRVVDATSPECDLLLQTIADEHRDVVRNRVDEYRILETKIAARETEALTDGDFLIQSDIHAVPVFRMDNLDFADRIEELINRSNQLNYTESRVAPGEVRRYLLDIDHYHVYSVFVWDKYGYYGLVGIGIYDFQANRMEHFAFSCRVMHMGIEAFLIEAFKECRVEIDETQLKKPLPRQDASAITLQPYSDAVRERLLAREAPRDWSAIQIRVMADCQSGAFYHYSRFRDVIDYDNRPRLFTLPMMHTEEYKAQKFPPYLVYTAASDYVSWRWEERTPRGRDVDLVLSCMDQFAETVVVGGKRKCLLLLPPQSAPVEMYGVHRNCDPVELHRLHAVFNDAWRAIARKHPNHFSIIELEQHLTRAECSHIHHYIPSALKRITGMIDDWYERASKSD